MVLVEGNKWGPLEQRERGRKKRHITLATTMRGDRESANRSSLLFAV